MIKRMISAVVVLVLTAATSYGESHDKWIQAMLELKQGKSSAGNKNTKGKKQRTVFRDSLRKKYPVEMAWLLQDGEFEQRYIHSGSVRRDVPEETDFLNNYLDPKRPDSTYEKRLIRRALDSLEDQEHSFENEFEQLVKEDPATTDLSWLKLYTRICEHRRNARLSLYREKGARYIAFSQRNIYPDGHWYANFGYRVDSVDHRMFKFGGRLSVLDIQTGAVKVMLEDKTGAFRDPVVHFNGKKMLFAWRKGGTDNYLLYEINVDGTGLRQVTHGKYDDFEPIYLPDGDIMFTSSRSKRWVNCYVTQVSTLYRSDLNGNNMRRLSANVEHDNTPWLLNDGRIAYMRWEYVDRSQLLFHHLWVMNPDGTQQQALFGNMHRGDAYLDAKPIPGTKELVISAIAKHGRTEHRGSLATLTVDNGPDDKSQMKCFTVEGFRDPYPVIDTNHFLAAWDNDILLVNRNGGMEVLYSSDDMPVHEPRPIAAHKAPPVIPDRTDWQKKTGVLTLGDVRIGRNMGGVKEGEIDKLLILESLPKPINWGGGIFDMTSISFNGTFTLERVLGTVPVYSDGSANFEVPANRPLILAALDKNGSMVKRMHSFLSVMPGETLSCVGCHEKRTQAVPSTGKLKLAYARKPDPIKPLKGVPEIFDYPRDIQPILDKHCVSCHNSEKPSGGTVLNGDRGIVYTQSYMNLRARREFFLGENGVGNTAPRSVGDPASKLIAKASGKHHDVEMSERELMTLRTWINAGGYFTSTYASLGASHLFPSMVHWDAIKKKFKFPEIKPAMEAIKKNCASCHTSSKTLTPIESIDGFYRLTRKFSKTGIKGNIPPRYLQHILYNMSDPEKSNILKETLAVSAGGWATERSEVKKLTLDQKGKHKHSVIFESKDDPGYQAILKYIEAFSQFLKQNPMWNSPDFVPNKEYVREMKRYDVLPQEYDPATRAHTPNEIDRKYYDQTWAEAWPKEIRKEVFEN